MNGESAASLMTWRLSAEAAIRNALEQLDSYRKMQLAEDPAPGRDLLALAEAVGATQRTHVS
jgi:hypothetical protein